MLTKKILFDIGHPAQVHNFKNLYNELAKMGWTGIFIAKDKEMTLDLLTQYDLPYQRLSRNKKGILKKTISLIIDIVKFFRYTLWFRPSLILSRMSIHSVLVAKILNIPHIAFADTEKSLNLSKYVTCVLTGMSYFKSLGTKQIFYNGNIELAYLHPKRFAPNRNTLADLGIDLYSPYIILRFVAWEAHHDIGQKGFSFQQKVDLVKALSQYGKVYISSEKGLPNELKDFNISIPANRMHDVLAFASLYIGEGSTMASESACLGIPAIYVNSLCPGYIKDESNFDLVFHLIDFNHIKAKAVEILTSASSYQIYQKNRIKYLQDKIEVTSFWAWFIDKWPSSLEIVKANPHFQLTFK